MNVSLGFETPLVGMANLNVSRFRIEAKRIELGTADIEGLHRFFPNLSVIDLRTSTTVRTL